MLEFHKFHERGVEETIAEPGLGICESLYVFHRYIDPSTGDVFLEISQYVGQLECESEVDCIFPGADRLISEYLYANQSYRRGDPVAVFPEIGKCLILSVIQVHFHSIDQVEERLFRQVEFFDGIEQSFSERGRGPALKASVDFFAPSIQLSRGIGAGWGLIDYVIDDATETVHVLNGFALGPGKKQERVIEIRSRGPGQALRCLKGAGYY